jgi:hypothetical protein
MLLQIFVVLQVVGTDTVTVLSAHGHSTSFTKHVAKGANRYVVNAIIQLPSFTPFSLAVLSLWFYIQR